MNDSTERFSNRVENYVKYRPDYPTEILALFREEMGLTEDSVVVDIGSGTGISARVFLENGNEVFGVEPNEAMRRAGEEFLKDFPKFSSVNGTSTETGLADASVDIVIAAQAFHWFDRELTRAELKRILRPGGYVALIWNERQLDTNDFLREYEQFLEKFASDYKQVRHENIDTDKIRDFFAGDHSLKVFQNKQIFDLEGLMGRVLSSSYMPSAADEKYPAMAEELKALFTKHEEQGRITILYDTRVYYSQL